jgi:hypothetical protein
VIATVDFALHQLGHVPDAGDIANGRAPEFHHNFGHERAGMGGFCGSYIDAGLPDHNGYCPDRADD